ncbi:hypothetical protein LINPERHAP2_LOCUS38796, partial [Linum perenne]
VSHHILVKQYVARFKITVNNWNTTLVVKIIHCESYISSNIYPLAEIQAPRNSRLIYFYIWMQPVVQASISHQLIDDSLEIVSLTINT